MAQKNTELTKTARKSSTPDEIRFFPFIVAGVICFVIAVCLGTAGSLVFNSFYQQQTKEVATVENPPNVAENKNKKIVVAPVVQAESSPITEETKPKIENVVKVTGGEIAIGGGDTKVPLERLIVGDFLIAETEVTNAQYAEFLTETNYPEPHGWKNSKFPVGTENFPVSNVSWQDATAYCKWLEKKMGLPVRLPTEAEWELAARGPEEFKYPWGNEWEKKALITKETGGKISAVKSFPLNRSPFGAYDMAGNVWEWTQDRVGKNEEVTDEDVEEALKSGKTLRVVKGGAAKEKAADIFAQARYEIPEKTKVPTVGFRYIVEQK